MKRPRLRVVLPLIAALALLAFAAVGVAAPSGSSDLRTSKTDSPDPVRTGQTLTYTLRVENRGPQTATGVTVTDSLPKGVDLTSATAAAGSCAAQGRKVTCELGTIPFGANYGPPGTITLTVVPRVTGSITNTARVRSDQRDPKPGDNSAAATTRVLGAPTCRGIAATVIGTAGDDLLAGTDAPDVIVGLGGADTIRSKAGRDLVCAGTGRDFVAAGSAADRVFGGGGGDRLLGRGGPDLLRGGGGGDTIKGNRGSDRLRGGGGVDRCEGGPGADSIRCEHSSG